MCEPTTIMLIASTALAAKSAHDQGRASQKIANNNATMAEYAAADAVSRGEKDAIEVQRKGAAMKSAQRVGMAAKGLDLNYGTAADLQDQTDFFTQSDMATTRSNARKEAWRGNAQAQDFRSQGEFAAYNGKMQAAGSLLSGASKVDPKWYKN